MVVRTPAFLVLRQVLAGRVAGVGAAVDAPTKAPLSRSNDVLTRYRVVDQSVLSPEEPGDQGVQGLVPVHGRRRQQHLHQPAGLPLVVGLPAGLDADQRPPAPSSRPAAAPTPRLTHYPPAPRGSMSPRRTTPRRLQPERVRGARTADLRGPTPREHQQRRPRGRGRQPRDPGIQGLVPVHGCRRQQRLRQPDRLPLKRGNRPIWTLTNDTTGTVVNRRLRGWVLGGGLKDAGRRESVRGQACPTRMLVRGGSSAGSLTVCLPVRS
jgi:hypothetical protein